nr:11136_t:CDS:2 [Entrophospora candida]
MELPIVYYPRPEYIETTIIQTDCVIRGDLRRTGTGHAVVVAIGRYCLLTRGSIIRPPYKTYKGVFSYYPVKIGDHVTIGEGSVVEAAIIGSFVHIGKNCVIGRFAIIKDCCRIEDNTVISPNTVVPSFSIYEGSPGVFVDELPECVQDIYEAKTKDYYSKFQPKDMIIVIAQVILIKILFFDHPHRTSTATSSSSPSSPPTTNPTTSVAPTTTLPHNSPDFTSPIRDTTTVTLTRMSAIH